MKSLASTFFIIASTWVLVASADESAIKLKPGAGQDRVATACAVCHSLDYIQMNSPFLDRKGWEAVVTKMAHVMGAPVKDEEIPALADYLTAQYGVAAPIKP